MLSAKQITSNTTWYLLALVLQKVLSFVYFTLLARHLGAALLGQYYLAISFATMFSVAMDLGLSAVLIRETAKEPNKAQLLFRQILSLKLLLGLLTAFLIIILDLLLFSQDAVRPLIYLTTLIVLIDSFTLFFYAYIRGQQNLRYESFGTILFQVIIMVLGLSAMWWYQTVWPFLVVTLIASLFNLLWSAIFVLVRYRINLSLVWDKVLTKNIFSIAWPFALSAIFAKVYAYVDSFILKILTDDSQVGFYSVAYKVTFAWQFIPLAFVAALYPAFSHYWQQDKDKLEATLKRAIWYLAYIALPIAAGIAVLAPTLVHLFYTKSFTVSILPLQILILSLPFLFVNFALSYFLNATDRQKINTRNLGLTMILNVVLNFLLIPKWSASGAALASSISTVFLCLLDFIAVKKVLSVDFKLAWPLFKAVLATLIMVAFLSWGILPWFYSMILAAIIYFVSLMIFGNIGRQDWRFIKESLFNK